MINLPAPLTPSELLRHDELPPFVDELLRGARSLRREGRLPEAERCALDALDASQEAGTHASRAAALTHLADVRREMGRLGPALADCQHAHRIFRQQASRFQRHNEAVAAYALGLIHQLLGSDMDALKWYQESRERFEGVREDWIAVNALAQAETCARVQQWTEALSEFVTAARTDPEATLANRIWIPVIPSQDEEDGFAVAELGIDQYRVERESTVDGQAFRVQPLKGKRRRISLEPGVECYAMRVPDEAHTSLGTGRGDYALVTLGQTAKEGPGVLETLAGPEFGHFERDDEGNITFIRPDATVIGAEDIGEGQVGRIAALLRPVSPPPPSAPPSAEPSAPAPPPEPPPDSADPHDRLLHMVGGDQGVADRLIEYEREHTPDASEAELAENAIVRLVRDRQ